MKALHINLEKIWDDGPPMNVVPYLRLDRLWDPTIHFDQELRIWKKVMPIQEGIKDVQRAKRRASATKAAE